MHEKCIKDGFLQYHSRNGHNESCFAVHALMHQMSVRANHATPNPTGCHEGLFQPRLPLEGKCSVSSVSPSHLSLGWL